MGSSLLSIQSWPSSIPPAPSTALPTALTAALSTSTAVCIPSSTCYPCSTSLCALALLLLALRPSYSLHRSPFTVLVISDSPSLMYLLAISRFLLCRFYSQRSRVGFRSLLPLLGQRQLNMLYICLTMDHSISFSLS